MKQRVIFSATALLIFSVSAADAGTVMYRYTSAEGSQVFSYTLPPGQARHGYEKVDMATGRVETVPAQLSPEERALVERQEQALAACRDELRHIYTLYGNEDDIDRAQAAALDVVAKRISQLKLNVDLAEAELERLQQQAANTERAGRTVPEELIRRMDRGRRQIDALENQVAEQQNQQEQLEHRFGRERERFRHGACPEPGTDVAAAAGR